MSRAADLYRDSALRFTCEETITWNLRGPGGTSGREKFDYIFVHHEEDGLQDYRSFPGSGGPDRVPRRLSPSEYGIPRFLRSAYLWMFIFRESRWRFHRYQILGEDSALGRPAVKVGFEPIPPQRLGLNDWYGTAWVDRETAQILRIEAFGWEDHQTRMELEAQLAGSPEPRRPFYVERFETEFSVEKNGMRFPGRVTIEGSRTRARGGRGSGKYSRKRVLEVEHLYQEYRFFGVRTAEEVQHALRGTP